jgi:hypothetical protein
MVFDGVWYRVLAHLFQRHVDHRDGKCDETKSPARASHMPSAAELNCPAAPRQSVSEVPKYHPVVSLHELAQLLRIGLSDDQASELAHAHMATAEEWRSFRVDLAEPTVLAFSGQGLVYDTLVEEKPKGDALQLVQAKSPR